MLSVDFHKENGKKCFFCCCFLSQFTHIIPVEALGTMATLSHNPSGYNHNYQEVSISVLGQYFYSYCRRRTHLLVVFGISVSQSRKVAHLEKFTATSILSET